MNQPPEETSGSGDRAAGRLLLAATLLVTTCYLLPQIQSGWIPHDEGLLAQTAERVLGGEVPHRDFDDMYSGGLTYLHAAAMKVLGTRLSSMRWVLLLASLVGVACWYGIALCFAPPWAAMLSSLLCLAWSTPNYFASLPSWYSLVLASLTIWLLLQYHRQRQSRWLLAVGVCCGLSLMIKIVGLYMIAAALLSLLAISFELEEGQQRQPPTSSGRLVSLVPGCLLGLLVLLLVRQHLGTGVLMLFVFPSVALAVMLVQIQSHGRGGALPSAIARAIRPGLIFSAGLAIPLVAWIGSYLAAGAVGDLVHGIFVLPRVRLDSVTSALASPWVLAWGLPAMVLLGLGNRRTPARQANLLALLAVVSGLPLLLACLMGPADGRPVTLLASAYKPLFLASFYLPVLVVVSGILIVRQDHPARGERDTRLFIVLGPLAVMTLIQYPYSTGIYFCYYAPLLILGVLAVVRSQRDGWQRSWAGIGIFYLLFAVLMMNFSSPRSLGFVRQGIMRDGPLSERADLAVNLTDLGDYGELLELLETVTQPGEAIYAAPDCPEIYFLANRRNPTRTMYDLFDTRSDREQHLLQMLEDEKVKAVVVNVVPEFSRSLSGRFLAEIQRRFPHLERIGIVRRNPSAPASPRFQVYWR